MTKILHYTAIFIVLISVVACTQKLVCYSQTKKEGFAIYKYFYGIQEGTFIDVNPTYPIWDSDTIYLRSKGWKGINLINNKQTITYYNQFRSQQINIYSQQKSSASNIGKLRLPQVCQYFSPKSIQLVAINERDLNSFIIQEKLPSQSCRPEVILVRLQSVNSGINQQLKEKMLGKDYVFEDNQYSFVIFIEKNSTTKYRNRILKNQRIIDQNNLYGFSRIIETIEQKNFNKSFISSQLKGNLMDNKILLHFSKFKTNIDIDLLIKNTSPSVKNILIMQLNPQWQKILLKQNSYKSQVLQLPNSKSFYHITYNQSGNTYHIYIFDHNFPHSDSKSNLEVIPLVQMKTKPYSSSQIEKYNINDIDRLNIKNQTFNDNTKQKDRQKEQERQQEYRRSSQKQKQQMKQKQALLQQQIQRLKTFNYTNKNKVQEQQDEDEEDVDSIQNLNQSTLIKKTKTKKKKEPSKQDIAYLTPENLFANKQVKNTTILVVILVLSVIGSIMLTAFVTAVIMKKRHRAHVRSRIKTNAQMQSEINSQNQKQSHPSFHDKI